MVAILDGGVTHNFKSGATKDSSLWVDAFIVFYK